MSPKLLEDTIARRRAIRHILFDMDDVDSQAGEGERSEVGHLLEVSAGADIIEGVVGDYVVVLVLVTGLGFFNGRNPCARGTIATRRGAIAHQVRGFAKVIVTLESCIGTRLFEICV